jgi:hypothetical protein
VRVLYCSQQRAYPLTNLRVRLKALQNFLVADLLDFHDNWLLALAGSHLLGHISFNRTLAEEFLRHDEKVWRVWANAG